MRSWACALIIVLVQFFPVRSYCQKQYNVWYFGYRVGLDFSTTPPIVLSNPSYNSDENSAAICDEETGQLLFYTDGATVWNRMLQPMPGIIGKTLASTPTASQGSLILRSPSNKYLYYIFTSDCGNYCQRIPNANYSIIDMRLDNGLGDITLLNQRLLDSTDEKVTAVYDSSSCSFWVLFHKLFDNRFYAYRFDGTGVHTDPVISPVGKSNIGKGPNILGIGYLVSSFDGKKLALSNYVGEIPVQLFDFDINTGIISNPIELPYYGPPYGLAFSPDNTKLYATSALRDSSILANDTGIVQYDLTDPNIKTSGILVGRLQPPTFSEYGTLMPGPDGKIYVSTLRSNTIGVIEDPNARGVNCAFNPATLPLPSTTNGFPMYGLNNLVPTYMKGPARSRKLSLISEINTDTIGEGIVRVPIGFHSSENVTAIDFSIRYDTNTLEYLSADQGAGQPISERFVAPGSVGIAVNRPQTFGKDSAFVWLTFNKKLWEWTCTSFSIDSMVFASSNCYDEADTALDLCYRCDSKIIEEFMLHGKLPTFAVQYYPTNRTINVSLARLKERFPVGAEITIYDLLGHTKNQFHLTLDNETITLPVTDLESGSYLLRMSINGLDQIAKIIVMK